MIRIRHHNYPIYTVECDPTVIISINLILRHTRHRMKHKDWTSASEVDMKGQGQEQGTEHIGLGQERKLGRDKVAALVQGMAEGTEQARAIVGREKRSI
jgi:hypothetical protein